MSERFNTAGADGRDCPVCFRQGSLTGKRDGDNPKLTCSGCLTVFELTWGDSTTRDTLTRIRTPERTRPLLFPMQERR